MNDSRYLVITNADIDKFKNDNSLRICYRNFGGDPDDFNPNGCIGNFTVFVTEDFAKKVQDAYRENDGSFMPTITSRQNRDGDTEYKMKVNVRWDKVPPTIWMVNTSDKKKTLITEDTVRVLNKANIIDCKLLISPSRKNANYVSQAIFVIDQPDIISDYIDRFDYIMRSDTVPVE